MTTLSPRFTQAVEYARIAHAGHFRKGTSIPYLYHLLGVASLVLEYGGSEDQAIAALLHDVLEDCGSGHEPSIRVQFGDAVARIVRDCTDGSAESKGRVRTDADRFADWVERKLLYVAHLATEDEASLLVSACDKLHNVRAILADLQGDAGPDVFERFTAGRLGTLQYYEALARLLLERADAENPRFRELAREFDRTVARIHELAGAQDRIPLGRNTLTR
ncbi:HD domain-containing protein [Pseudofulvimonas gallinarii]|jgi:(p)ppGpp synthase/HD superfamily hydrolase|uniref:HD domain-containing protein n=1 Tax=Pseudofulvimonas gallinarii TaxID=634155 RepID=A0A4R3LGY6_9GAMM|nr:HD domain-containing protein [Pseudofulvimonas gallinarii]TCS98820.1 HD domain-containing protein [Pseudofulvimonas gallinarii]THD14305.1 guanosine polyphosphate pyrophosphohydrolase [Pseudofulvimonas gallinarii]